MKDPRHTRRWREHIVPWVIREEPLCWLQLPGCTTYSQTADHVLPWITHPHLGLERVNLRGACYRCNNARGDRPLSWVEARRLPPAALEFFA